MTSRRLRLRSRAQAAEFERRPVAASGATEPEWIFGDNQAGSRSTSRRRDFVDNPSQAEIVEAEDRLRTAMLNSDVAALNELLSPELLFTNHLGQLLSKDDDLAAHRSGALKLMSLEPSEQHVRVLDDVAIVSVRMQLSGTYDGAPANGNLRFTRVWARTLDQRWQIVAAHAGLVAESSS